MDFALLTEGRTRSLEPPFYIFRFEYLNESILGDRVKIADLAIKWRSSKNRNHSVRMSDVTVESKLVSTTWHCQNWLDPGVEVKL